MRRADITIKRKAETLPWQFPHRWLDCLLVRLTHLPSSRLTCLHQDYINHSPSVVALLVSGTSQTHSILAHHGKRREILVIITGVESDYEVMTRGIGPLMTSPTPDHPPPLPLSCWRWPPASLAGRTWR